MKEITEPYLHFDEDSEDTYAIKHPNGFVLLKYVSFWDYYTIQHFRYDMKRWYQREPKPWKYYQDKGYEVVRLRIKILKNKKGGMIVKKAKKVNNDIKKTEKRNRRK